jgi:small subunit ribosomal protein S2
VHFGHPSKRWNPKMEKYIFAKRARSHIFDLAQTVEATEKVKDYLRKASANGARVLMVGTKKQAQEVIRENALRCGAWYINQRWLGGMLTNFQTIQKRIERLIYLEDALAKGTVETQTKRESLRLETEVKRLNKFFGGIKEMDKLPDILFIVDTEKEDIAVREARRLGIPIVAIVDTNSNPDDADFIIPGNDDAVRSVGLLTSHIADAILEGKEQFRVEQEEKMAADAELEAQEAAARAAAQALAAERAAAAAAEKQRKQAEAEGAAKAAASAGPETPAQTDEKTEAKAEETPAKPAEEAAEKPAAEAAVTEAEPEAKPKAAKPKAAAKAKATETKPKAAAKPKKKAETPPADATEAKAEKPAAEATPATEAAADNDKKEEESTEEKK